MPPFPSPVSAAFSCCFTQECLFHWEEWGEGIRLLEPIKRQVLKKTNFLDLRDSGTSFPTGNTQFFAHGTLGKVGALALFQVYITNLYLWFQVRKKKMFWTEHVVSRYFYLLKIDWRMPQYLHDLGTPSFHSKHWSLHLYYFNLPQHTVLLWPCFLQSSIAASLVDHITPSAV